MIHSDDSDDLVTPPDRRRILSSFPQVRLRTAKRKRPDSIPSASLPDPDASVNGPSPVSQDATNLNYESDSTCCNGYTEPKRLASTKMNARHKRRKTLRRLQAKPKVKRNAVHGYLSDDTCQTSNTTSSAKTRRAMNANTIQQQQCPALADGSSCPIDAVCN